MLQGSKDEQQNIKPSGIYFKIKNSNFQNSQKFHKSSQSILHLNYEPTYIKFTMNKFGHIL